MTRPAEGPAYSVPVYRAVDFNVTNGANLGDPISFADELDLDDTYDLRVAAQQHRLMLCPTEQNGFCIAPDTKLGRPGHTVHIDSCLTMMSGTGQTTELLILVEVDTAGLIVQIYVLPLAQIEPKMGYDLVKIDRDTARSKFAEVACVAFSRGTHITMSSGAQVPIEELRVGDDVLTRDDGTQKIRWIGQSTLRAVGEFAPICIRAGTLNNTNDLRISPEHRLFIYQRSDALGAGRAEVLVRARHLVNGDTVVQEDGGFIDYFQLLFDSHQIIFAEGIAAETLLIDPRTRAALPQDVGDAMDRDQPDHGDRPHQAFEVSEKLLKHPNAAKLLKGASNR